MSVSDLGLAAVRALLASLQRVPTELLAELEADPREGVRALAGELRRKAAQTQARQAESEQLLCLERAYHDRGLALVAGVDEAGRGPLAGPVLAAAVIFPKTCDHPGARDSKQLTPERREELFGEIQRRALAVGVGRAEHDEIDRVNIYQASLAAMYRAVEALPVAPQAVLVDGPMVLRLAVPQEAVIGGDSRCLSIAAASIIAKVTRDRLMVDYDRRYPGYGFARHKGYPTTEHLQALRLLGPCPIHRRSFRAVADCGEFRTAEWAFFYDSLTAAAGLEELETIAGQVRSLRHLLTGCELEGLRRIYRQRRQALVTGADHAPGPAADPR